MMEIKEISSIIFQRPQPVLCSSRNLPRVGPQRLPNSACFTALDTPLKPRVKRVRYPIPLDDRAMISVKSGGSAVCSWASRRRDAF